MSVEKLKYLFMVTILLFCTEQSLLCREYINTNISTATGLSQNDVRCIHQDSRGYVWIATHDGINRYEGSDFKIYRMGDRGLTTSLTMSIAEDSSGDLWILTLDKGLFKYDAKLDYFFPIQIETTPKRDLNSVISYIAIDGDDNVWIAGVQVLCKLTPIDKHANKYKATEYTISGSNNIRSLNCDDRGGLTVTSAKIVYQYDKVQNEFRRYFNLENINQIQWQNNKIYVIQEGVVYLFDPVDNKLVRLSDIKAWIMYVASNNVLWLCSPDGIYQIDLTLPADHPKQTALVIQKGYMINSIIEDSFGNMWFGAYRKGALLSRENLKPFRTIQKDSSIENIYEDHRKQIWTATVFGELTVYKNNDFTQKIQTGVPPEGQHTVIHCITEHRGSKKIFIGSESGLFVSDSRGDNYKFQHNPIYRIYHVLEDSSYVWVCTHQSGLILFDVNSQTIVRTLYVSQDSTGFSSDVMRHAMKDSNGNIWVGTAKRLVIMTAQERFQPKPQFRHLNIPDSTIKMMTQISHIMQTANSDIWVGTHGVGLFRLTDIDDKFNCKIAHYDTDTELSNNTIKGILEDANGRIWVSTNKGLNCINVESNKIATFSTDNGLQDYAFCDFSCAKLSNGNLAFGGVRGMNVFNPDQIKTSTINPIMVITDFQLGREIINVSEEVNGRVILQNRLSDGSQIHLKHNQNNFSLFFSALHYQPSQENQFMYRLKGYDKEWNTSTSNQSAKYTNLAPGNYVFELKGSINGELWSPTLSVGIEIETPFWYCWYAYLFYVLCLVTLIRFIAKNYVRRQREKSEILMMKKETQYLQKLSEVKMNFFTNVSHEFRTPLTLIISPLQTLMSQKNLDSKTKDNLLQTMSHNSNILMRLVNQTLGMVKHDSGKLVSNLQRTDFNLFSKDVFRQFYHIASQRNIEMQYYSSADVIEISIDVHQMEEVFYNLISNAIKHTPEGGTVACDITEEENWVIVRISDTGKGIDDDVKAHIFERFYTSPNSDVENNGIGIGLSLTKNLVELHGGTINVISSLGQGTTFIVRIPNDLDSKASRQTLSASDVCSEETIIAKSSEDTTIGEQVEQTTILVVDDNREILELLTALLSPAYHVITALNGEEGYKKCIDEMPTLVVTDILMPVMNGIELCRLIKNNRVTSHIPIIMLTAKGTKQGQTEGLNVLADAYCLKPFDNDILLSTIESIVVNRRNLAQKFSKEFILNSANSTVISIDDDFLKPLIKIIDEHLSNPALSIELICEIMGISQISLNKKLKKITNLTTSLFIRHVKMKRAAEMLAMGRYTVSEVTYAVGLNDLKYFRECFRKEFGVNPSDYGKDSRKQQ